MNKLTNLQGQLSIVANPLAPTHANEAERSAYRYKTMPWRTWYNSGRWRKLRMAVFRRDGFTCVHTHVLLIHKTNQLVAHHKKPHKGNAALFWDINNLETVSKEYHDKILQAREREEQMRGR